VSPLKFWWSRGPAPGNMGDVITPHILNGFNIAHEWAERGEADYFSTGSIIRFAGPGQKVIGSGIMWSTEAPNPAAEYLAVRGPLTRAAVLDSGGDCPEVYGDPALLLPDFYRPVLKKQYRRLFVPHYTDRVVLTSRHPKMPWADPIRANPLHVVRDILRARTVLSSSLHGLVVAHAYGIPAAWVRLSDNLSGDDIKFYDYAASVGITLVPYKNPHKAVAVLPETIDLEPLREAFRCLA